MEGPYFVDDKLRRSDIRTDPSDGSLKPGVSLNLTFRVSRIDGLFDTRGKRFLRGTYVVGIFSIFQQRCYSHRRLVAIRFPERSSQGAYNQTM